ncbi:MAG TPA: GGDEF domain-containing response regulator [candidate division Zixibacteria bacterium]|nr:GGDEF domain-containing response regulator [candidate division Zixibacteria bacterium]
MSAAITRFSDWSVVSEPALPDAVRTLLIQTVEDAHLTVCELRRRGLEVTFERVETPRELNEALARSDWDVVIADYTLPRLLGSDALEIVRRSSPDLPFVFVAEDSIQDKAIAGMLSGAQDCVAKETLTRLAAVVRREVREARVRQEGIRARRKLQYLAYHDPITDLPNYAYFRDRLEQAILNARRRVCRGALLVFKVNEFREINESFGHEIADRVLAHVGRCLKETVPDGCELACLRANEFAILIPVLASEEQAIRLVLSAAESLHKPLVVGDVALEAQSRFGVVYFPDHGSSAEILTQNARKAQYQARKTCSLYSVYLPHGAQNRISDLALVSDLRRAIADDRLYLLYQPKMDLRTGATVGVEALARWNHPVLGTIPPARFIPLAERTGLITPLTLWSLEQALRQGREWADQGFPLRVAVNLSMQNSSVADLWERLFDRLAAARLGTHQLQLEITESVVMINPAATLSNMKRLKELGASFAIDDFGIGYSSLAYLKRLPIDEIKIDKSFVVHAATEAEDGAIVKLIVQMGHELGLKIVAEGIEDAETLDFLARLGCDMAQGYYIGRPLPGPELGAWLAARRKQGTS